MTTVIIDEKTPTGRKLLKDLKKHPQVAHIADDNTPLPVSEEELISQEEFKEHLEKRVYERLGLKITL